MRKRFLLSLSLALALVALCAISYAETKPAMMTHQYRCQDRNQSLYFVVYEVDGKLSNGQMYVENMQVANLTVEQAGSDVIKAKVNGNSANVAFQLFKSGKIMVANYQTNNRVEICKASYAYK
jgi:hypothetical protein